MTTWTNRVVPVLTAGLLLLAGGAAVVSSDAAVPVRDDDALGVRARMLERMGVPAWHKSGWRGRGLKVAVLDSGFRGYREHLGKALPERVTVRSFRADGDLEAKDSQHGILCGEAVHAVAPEAELLLANWDADKPDAFLDAVRWAKDQGARVVTCSVVMPTWSDGEGGGAVHKALAEILGTDVLFFASAGNTALRHWGGAFHDGGDGWHEWAPGRTDDVIRPSDGERPSVELYWPAGAEYELSVRDLTAEQEVGHGEAVVGDGYGRAAVRFDPTPGHSYAVRVRLARGTAGAFHLVVLGGGLDDATARGSVPFPGDGAEVVAVAAVDDAGRRQPYSSCGPNGPAAKPDLAAAVPFPSAWRARPFAGTSAAAPQAAGLAALVWSRHADWTAAQARDALLKAARRSDAADAETGRGALHLP
jgi:subtilisin family serine protease